MNESKHKPQQVKTRKYPVLK